MFEIFPYPRLFGDLDLVVDEVRIDGHLPTKNPADPQFLLIDLTTLEREDWAGLTLKFHVDGPPDELAKLERDGADPTITAVAFCKATNERQAVRLQRMTIDVSRWVGQIELDRANFRGKVELYGVLAATVGGSTFRLLKRTDAWSVYFDEPAILPIEGTLRVQWAHFKGDDRPRSLPDNAENESFYVDLESTVPIVYLNADFEGLPDLLSDEQKRPAAERALRDAEYRRIATAVWTEIFNVSVAAIRKADDEEPDWPAIDWQEKSLRSLLPRIYDMTPTEALAQAHGDSTGDGALGLHSRAQVAISKEIAAAQSLRRSIKQLTGVGGGA